MNNLIINDEVKGIKSILLIIDGKPVVYQIELPRKFFTISKSIIKYFNDFQSKHPEVKGYKPANLLSRFEGVGNYLILSYSLEIQ